MGVYKENKFDTAYVRHVNKRIGEIRRRAVKHPELVGSDQLRYYRREQRKWR